MRRSTETIIALVLLLAAASAQAATLYVSEFTQTAPRLSGLPLAQAPAAVLQNVAVSGTSAQSSAFSSATRLVRLFADAAMCVVVGGTSPTATITSQPMAANQTEYFLVNPGDKVAAITCTP